MILNQEDWRKLRVPLLVFGLALVLVGLLVLLADKNRQAIQKISDEQLVMLNQAKQKYQASGQEKETIFKYLPVYNELLAKGFIGEEKRIEWIEKLREVHSQHKLFSIDYSIGQQEKFSPSYLPHLGSFVMNRSTMKVELGMLHEGDLLTLLDGLHEQSAPFIVRECELKKPVGAKFNLQNVAPNMQATCLIDWLTLRDPQLRTPS